MLKECIEKILSLAVPTTVTFGGRNYTDRALVPVKEPVDDYETVATLTGFADLLKAGFTPVGDKQYVHVESHTTVTMLDHGCTIWGHRTQRLTAVLPSELKAFEYGRYMGVEAFIIGLMSMFVETPDRETILRQVSKITDEDVSVSEDDGISQKVTVKASVALKGEETVKRVVTLAPYRTFREVAQPESQFVFRVKKTDEGPACAIFEADGGKWRLEAMQHIKTWLGEKLPTVTIVA